MKPIFNPWLFYLIDVMGNVKDFLEFILVLSGIAVCVFLCYPMLSLFRFRI